MLSRKQQAEIGSNITILMLKIKNALAPKKFEDEELEALLHENSCQTLAEFAESLKVDYNSFETCESIRNENKSEGIGCPMN